MMAHKECKKTVEIISCKCIQTISYLKLFQYYDNTKVFANVIADPEIRVDYQFNRNTPKVLLLQLVLNNCMTQDYE